MNTDSTDTIRIGSLRPTDLDGSPIERRCVIPAGMTDKKALLTLQRHLNKSGVHGQTTLVTGPSLDPDDPRGERAGILAPIGGATSYGSDPDQMLHVLGYEQTLHAANGKAIATGEAFWDEGEPVSPLAQHITPSPKITIDWSDIEWSNDTGEPVVGRGNIAILMAVPIRPVNELDLIQQIKGTTILPDPDADHPIWAVIVEGHFAGLSRSEHLDEDIRAGVITNTKEFIHPRVHVFSS